MDKKRNLCIKKDFITSRNPERISVICGLIEELWERYRLNNLSINFFQLLDLIELSASGKEHIDTFYWEDNKWYDILQGLIGGSKKLEQNNLLENVMDMQEITNCFKEYWLMYPDYRFKQILNVFNEVVRRDKEELSTFDSRVWKKYFLKRRIQMLEHEIAEGEKLLNGIENGEVFTMLGSEWHERYINKLTSLIQKNKTTLDTLREEYKNDFRL